MSRTLSAWAGVAVRGLGMGIAEVVPGVSGGTIAFVSGIYDELVDTLAGLSRQSPLDFFRTPAQYWQARNLNFLLVLGLGMMVGIFTFARALTYLLATMPPVVWAFFFGLILASAWHIGRERPLRRLLQFGLPGIAIGFLLTQLPTAQEHGSLWLFFFGGVIAVCAWLLPAVSGSFMLLAMGLYAPVLAAVAELRLAVIATLAAGCAVGLLLFSRLLSWVLSRYRDALLALLTGFMIGALPNLWPWRGADGLLLPEAYAAAGLAPYVAGALAAVLAGMVALFALVRMGR
jgi:putative membrane protein